MQKKAIKYIIILLVVPLIISLIISFAGMQRISPSDSYDSINGTTNNKNYVYDEKVKSSSTFVYLSVFTLIVIGVGTWVYVKKKGEL